MKFFLCDLGDEFKVRVSESETIQEQITTLAENLFDVQSRDSYWGRVITFQSEKQFKNFLFWREIFNAHTPNKQFCFMKLARGAARRVKEILQHDTIYIDNMQ